MNEFFFTGLLHKYCSVFSQSRRKAAQSASGKDQADNSCGEGSFPTPSLALVG